MDALRLAVETQVLDGPSEASESREAWLQQALRMVARMPVLVAAYARFRRGQEPADPPGDLGHAAAYLYAIRPRN